MLSVPNSFPSHTAVAHLLVASLCLCAPIMATGIIGGFVVIPCTVYFPCYDATSPSLYAVLLCPGAEARKQASLSHS